MIQTRILRSLAVALIGSAAIALLASAPARSASFTVVDNACTGAWTWDAATSTLSCGAVTPPPPPPAGAPTGCTPTINGGTSPVTLANTGGSVTLNVTGCSPSTGITYAWTRNGSAANTSASWTDNLPANPGSSGVTTSYQVNVCNGAACTGALPASPLTATVPGVVASGGTNICAAQGFDKTLTYTWNWTTPFQATTIDTYSDARGRLGANGAIVIDFTVPAGGAMSVAGNISLVEYPGTTLIIRRSLSLSASPCDFSTTYPWKQSDINPAMNFSVGDVFPAFWPPLTPGKWYINIANRDAAGNSTCIPAAGANYPNCDLRSTLFKPTGY